MGKIFSKEEEIIFQRFNNNLNEKILIALEESLEKTFGNRKHKIENRTEAEAAWDHLRNALWGEEFIHK